MPIYSTVDMGNLREREGKASRIALSLMGTDLVILDELGRLPFRSAGGAVPFQRLSMLYEHTSVIIMNKLSLLEGPACLVTLS